VDPDRHADLESIAQDLSSVYAYGINVVSLSFHVRNRRLSHLKTGRCLQQPRHDQHWSADMTNPIPDGAEFFLDEYDAERFWAHVNFRGGTPYERDPLATAQGDCWIWTGTGVGSAGEYGRFKLFGEWHMAHRTAYKDFGRVLPDDLQIDHLCRIHPCVNPAHLEAVTQAVNMQRGINGNKTHCKHGHDYTAENTAYRGGVRWCLTCLRASRHRTYLRRRDAA
jgi:HNH endonuclease